MPKIEKMIGKEKAISNISGDITELLDKYKDQINLMEFIGILESAKLSLFTECWLKNQNIRYLS